MKIGTKELIVRLTAAAIGLALTGAVFRIAVAQSHEAIIVTQATRSGSYENSADERARLPDTAISGSFFSWRARLDLSHRLNPVRARANPHFSMPIGR